jgi:hypothetical protein
MSGKRKRLSALSVPPRRSSLLGGIVVGKTCVLKPTLT